MTHSFVALGLAVLAGFWLTAAVDGRRDLRRHGAGYLGTGLLLGAGLVAGAQRLFQFLGIVPSQLAVGLLLLLVTAAAGVAWLRFAGPDPMPRPVPPEGRGGRILAAGFLTLVVAQALLVLPEGLARPVFPWDAWSAWSVKPKVWIGLDETVDFVGFAAWLAADDPRLYTNEAWQYPELLPRLELWLLQWSGSWSAAAAMAPWTCLWPALLLLLHYGLREAGSSRAWAAATVFLVSALPVAFVQVALPGYLDLWVAAALLAGGVHLARAAGERTRRPLLLVALLLPVLLGLKLEGLVWALILAGATLAALLATPLRRGLYAALGLAVLGWWLAGGFSLEFAGRSWVLSPVLIDLPYLGRFPLEPTNTFPALARAFLALPNWHLLGYLALPLGLLALRGLHGSRLSVPAGAILFGGAGFLALLFFFTHASIWVNSMTASNRLALQLALLAVFYISVGLWRLWSGRPLAGQDGPAPSTSE